MGVLSLWHSCTLTLTKVNVPEASLQYFLVFLDCDWRSDTAHLGRLWWPKCSKFFFFCAFCNEFTKFVWVSLIKLVLVFQSSLKMPGSSTWRQHHGGGSSCKWRMRTTGPRSCGVIQPAEYESYLPPLVHTCRCIILGLSTGSCCCFSFIFFHLPLGGPVCGGFLPGSIRPGTA